MTRKLGQIIAVRENTWMIRIPMGCDPHTKQRNYYNRTVHGSLRQAQKFLGKKVNEQMNWELISSGTERRFAWINTSISGSRRSNRKFAARRMRAMRASSQSTSVHHLGRKLSWASGHWTSKASIKRCQIVGSHRGQSKARTGF